METNLPNREKLCVLRGTNVFACIGQLSQYPLPSSCLANDKCDSTSKPGAFPSYRYYWMGPHCIAHVISSGMMPVPVES
eukprot:3911128-Amphidinium_carterae.2